MNVSEIDNLIGELGKEIRTSKEDFVKEDALERLEAIAKEYKGEDQVISSFDIREKMKDAPPVEAMMFGAGMSKLDERLGGFIQKQLIVVSAPTKSGKTTFCIDLTSRLKEENPLWFPFEEPAEELIQKFLDRGEEPPLFYTPERMTGNRLNWIEKKIIEAKAKYDCKIVFIDHLHFIIDLSGDQRMDTQIGLTMRTLKSLAKKWNVVIVLIAHLKKTRVDTQPNLEDLRDSSFIAQEADTVLLLWRKTERNFDGEIEVSDEVTVSLQANRRTGKTGNVQMIFTNGHFTEKDHTRSSEETEEESLNTEYAKY